jgi:hypothetical protein
VQTTERYLGCKQRLREAVNDKIGLETFRSSRMIDSAYATFREARFCQTYFAKYFSKSSCDRFAPASVNKTDFAFVAGSEM